MIIENKRLNGKCIQCGTQKCETVKDHSFILNKH